MISGRLEQLDYTTLHFYGITHTHAHTHSRVFFFAGEGERERAPPAEKND